MYWKKGIHVDFNQGLPDEFQVAVPFSDFGFAACPGQYNLKISQEFTEEQHWMSADHITVCLNLIFEWTLDADPRRVSN